MEEPGVKANRKNGFALVMRMDPSIESQGSVSPPSSILTSSFKGQSHEMVERKQSICAVSLESTERPSPGS